MGFENVKELIKIIEQSNFVDFELDMKDEFHIKMSKNANLASSFTSSKKHAISLENAYDNIHSSEAINKELQTDELNKIAKNISEPVTIMPEYSKQKETENQVGNIIKSPIVGTFYSSSAPGKPPYAKLGDKIKSGDIVCIVEAMKVMNEIVSKFDGEIVEILVENGDMVEFNQPLFRIN